jgi:phosphocarrier protein HPr
MKTCDISIVNSLGMHARAAAKFVHTAGGFKAHIRVARGEREVDGKSIMGLLLLAAARGSSIRVSADGPDEEQAIAALCALVERGFDEAPADAGGASAQVRGSRESAQDDGPRDSAHKEASRDSAHKEASRGSAHKETSRGSAQDKLCS